MITKLQNYSFSKCQELYIPTKEAGLQQELYIPTKEAGLQQELEQRATRLSTGTPKDLGQNSQRAADSHSPPLNDT